MKVHMAAHRFGGSSHALRVSRLAPTLFTGLAGENVLMMSPLNSLFVVMRNPHCQGLSVIARNEAI